MTITLPAGYADRISEEATRRGTDPTAVVLKLLDQALPPLSPGNQATIALIRQWMAADADLTPAELERNRMEGEEFMRNLNRNRQEMEGPNARQLWP